MLYFITRRANKPLGIDEVYEYLVPDQYKMNIQGVGIMGGISSGVRANDLDTRTRGSYIVVSSSIRNTSVFCAPLQHCGRHEGHRERT